MASTVVDFNTLRKSCASCALAQLCLPASIGAEGLRQLDQLVQQRKPVDRGSVLFSAGAGQGKLYVVRAGSFKTYVDLPDGDSQVLGFHLPGELIGLDALPSEVHRCNAEALERASVCEVPFNELSHIAADLPEMQHQLYRVISDEFAREQEHMVMMGRRQAPSRLAIFLRSLSERRSRLGLDPKELNLSMSRQDIANYLGLVIETISRLMSRFQTQGVLEVERRSVRILDMAALHALAEGGEEGTSASSSSSSA